jgi:hypothetical protein
VNHPDYNNENVPWSESTNGKLWNKRFDKNNNPVKVLPWESTLSGTTWNSAPPIPTSKKRSNNSNFTPNNNNKKRKLFEINNIIDNNTSTIPNFDYSLPCLIQVNNNSVEDVKSKVLFDTGALHGNYINLKFAKSLSKLGININKLKNHTVCSAFGECYDIVGVVDLNIKFLNKNESCCCNNNKIDIPNDFILLSFHVIISPYDIIIGLPTIMKYKLFSLLEDYYNCLHGGCENNNSISVVNECATQLSQMQLASIYMSNQSSSGFKRETMKKYIDHESD